MSTQNTSQQVQYYIGIDASARSTGVGLCRVHQGVTTRVSLTIKPPSDISGGERLSYLFTELQYFLCQHGCDGLTDRLTGGAIEGASHDSKNLETVLSEVRGVFKLLCDMLGIELLVVAPKQLKKFITGRGDASKEDVLAAVDPEKWAVLNDDEADASGLCDLAHALDHHETTDLTRKQLEMTYQFLEKQDPKARIVTSRRGFDV